MYSLGGKYNSNSPQVISKYADTYTVDNEGTIRNKEGIGMDIATVLIAVVIYFTATPSKQQIMNGRKRK